MGCPKFVLALSRAAIWCCGIVRSIGRYRKNHPINKIKHNCSRYLLSTRYFEFRLFIFLPHPKSNKNIANSFFLSAMHSNLKETKEYKLSSFHSKCGYVTYIPYRELFWLSSKELDLTKSNCNESYCSCRIHYGVRISSKH